jgi:hypothetical protein
MESPAGGVVHPDSEPRLGMATTDCLLSEPVQILDAPISLEPNNIGLPTATIVARTIREQIQQELNLTAATGSEQVLGKNRVRLAQTG